MEDKMKERYARAYTEVLEILYYVPKESVGKIPKSMLNVFRRCCDKHYDYHIDINKPFEEQVISEETRAILANIFRDYWATPKQRESIMKMEDLEIKELRLQKYGELIEDDDS